MMALEYHRVVPRFTEDEINADVDGSYVFHGDYGSLTYADIVREYKATGKYFDIDYPGGIDRLVKDFEAGLLNAG